MSALVCDICGGNLVMDASGEFAVCESCGMKHSKDRVKAKVREIQGTVKIDGAVETVKGEAEKKRLLNIIRMQVNVGNLEKALRICQKVNTEYPEEVEAYFNTLEIISQYGVCLTDVHHQYLGGIGSYIEDIGRIWVTMREAIYSLTNDKERVCKLSDKYFDNIINGVCLIKYYPKGDFSEKIIIENLTKIFGVEKAKKLLEIGLSNAKIVNEIEKPLIEPKYAFPKVIFYIGKSAYIREFDCYYEGYNKWFHNVPCADNQLLKQELAKTMGERRLLGVCRHCGGDFKGIFNKVCSVCGKPKDY